MDVGSGEACCVRPEVVSVEGWILNGGRVSDAFWFWGVEARLGGEEIYQLPAPPRPVWRYSEGGAGVVVWGTVEG